MEKITRIRIIIVAIFSFIFNAIGILAIPWGILLIFNIFDYATGIMAAPYRQDENDTSRPVKSETATRGIKKKVSMHLLVIVGCLIDIMVKYSASMGFNINVPFIFATVIACWIVFNESISIVENIDDIGGPIPGFLLPLLKMIRGKINDAAQKQIEVNDKGENNESM